MFESHIKNYEGVLFPRANPALVTLFKTVYGTLVGSAVLNEGSICSISTPEGSQITAVYKTHSLFFTITTRSGEIIKGYIDL